MESHCSLPVPDVLLAKQYSEFDRDEYRDDVAYIKKIFENKITFKLQEMKYSDKEAKDLAKSMMFQGERLGPVNATPEVQPYEEYNKLIQECNSYNSTTLQIYAPSSSDEQDMRLKQLDNYIKILAEGDNKVVAATCASYQEMLSRVKKFLSEVHDSMEAIVIFNCHGDEKGIKFSQNSESITLKRISEDIYTLRKGLKDDFSEYEVPFRVRLVFAQCWSRMAEEGECCINGFDIVRLSTPTRPYTNNSYIPITINGEIIGKDWHHRELESWAKKIKTDHNKYNPQSTDSLPQSAMVTAVSENDGQDNATAIETNF